MSLIPVLGGRRTTSEASEGREMTPDSYFVIGEYGIGAEGPTMIIVLTSRSAAEWLKGLFLGMVGSKDRVDLASQPCVRLKGVGKLNSCAALKRGVAGSGAPAGRQTSHGAAMTTSGGRTRNCSNRSQGALPATDT